MSLADPETPDVAAPPAKKGSRRRWITAIVVVLVVAALGIALARGWGHVSQYDWRLEPAWLVLGAVLFIARLRLQRARLRRGGGMALAGPSHRRVALSIWARSLLARYVPGNVMMVVGRAVMAHDEGVPKRATLAATIYEQALALGIATVGAVAFLAAYGNPGEGGLLWLLASCRSCSSACTRCRSAGCRHGRCVAAGTAAARGAVLRPAGRQALAALRHRGRVPLVSAFGRSCGPPPEPEIGGVVEIGLAFIFAFVISFLAFIIPSGIGVRDGIFAVALARHLPGEVALALSGRIALCR